MIFGYELSKGHWKSLCLTVRPVFDLDKDVNEVQCSQLAAGAAEC